MVYTISVKRKFWFGFTTYRVTGHWTQLKVAETLLAEPRLVLELESGHELAIAGIAHRDFMIHSDFKAGKARLEEEAKEKSYQEWLEKEKADKEQLWTAYQNGQVQLKPLAPPAPVPIIPIPKQA